MERILESDLKMKRLEAPLKKKESRGLFGSILDSFSKKSSLPEAAASSTYVHESKISSGDSYTVDEEVVNKEQADRLVQKALKRNKKI